MSPEERLAALGIELPDVPPPLPDAPYIPARHHRRPGLGLGPLTGRGLASGTGGHGLHGRGSQAGGAGGRNRTPDRRALGGRLARSHRPGGPHAGSRECRAGDGPGQRGRQRLLGADARGVRTRGAAAFARRWASAPCRATSRCPSRRCFNSRLEPALTASASVGGRTWSAPRRCRPGNQDLCQLIDWPAAYVNGQPVAP